MSHNTPHSEETKQKIREKRKLQTFSIETRKKLSESAKGKHKYWLGKKQTKEHKNKISVGIKNAYDKKGRKKYKRYIHNCNTKEYKEWRSQVFQRDNWTCQTCQARGVYLEAHHIKSWAKFPELRNEVSNGVALCRECHKLTDNYKSKNK